MACYGDKFRGPAVADALELSECALELLMRSTHWPLSRELPPLMVELAGPVPEDQRSDYLRTWAAKEDALNELSTAIRSGDLPIWVAPLDSAEQLVAPGALSKIDTQSIQTGVYHPLSEAYRVSAGAPWLWERPLFVKRHDWIAVRDAIDRDRRGKRPASFARDEPVDITPWWSVIQTLAWIVTRIRSYVASLPPDERRDRVRAIILAKCERNLG